MCLEKKEYDIIKMVQHGKYCERIQDTIFGQTLIYWLKYHPQTAKEELWNLMRKMLLQITWFHKYGAKTNLWLLKSIQRHCKGGRRDLSFGSGGRRKQRNGTSDSKPDGAGNTSQIPKFTGRKESVRQ